MIARRSPGRRILVRAAVLAMLALFGLPAATVTPACATVTPARAEPAKAVAALTASGDGVVDRTLKDSRIAESSGLVVSRRTSGVVWTHNDSGNPPLLYAVGPTGATVGTARVTGVANTDWEALAPLTGRDGARLLAIGDIGDNAAARARVELALVPEPATSGSSQVSPVRVIRLRYPGGPTDAETLLADPRDGRLYVVSKGLFSSTIYAVPTQAWPGGPGTGRTVTATLVPVARVNLTLVTDGVVLPDGRVALRSYGTLAVLAPLRAPTGSATGAGSADVPVLTPLATTTVPTQRQGEALAVADAAAGVLLLTSEGAGSAVLRWTVPSGVWRAGAAAASSEAARGAGAATSAGSSRGGTASGGGAATSGPAAPGNGSGSTPWLITLAGAGAFVVLLLVAGLLSRLRRPW